MRLLVFIAIAVFSTSCGDGYDNIKCLQAVQKHYPKGIVFAIPDKSFNFIVADSCGAVYYVKTMGSDPTPTHEVLVRPCN